MGVGEVEVLQDGEEGGTGEQLKSDEGGELGETRFWDRCYICIPCF